MYTESNDNPDTCVCVYIATLILTQALHRTALTLITRVYLHAESSMNPDTIAFIQRAKLTLKQMFYKRAKLTLTQVFVYR